MKRLVEFPLQDGAAVLVEIDEPDARTFRGGRLDENADRAQKTFEASLDRIKPAATALVERLRSLTQPPQTVEVSFGVKFSAEAGAFIASAGTEATFTVKLTWTSAQASKS